MVFLVFNHFFLLILRQNDIFLRLAFRGSLRRTIRVGAREVKSQGTLSVSRAAVARTKCFDSKLQLARRSQALCNCRKSYLGSVVTPGFGGSLDQQGFWWP